MDALLCFPMELPAEVTLALQSAGLGHRAVPGPEALGETDGRRVGQRREGGPAPSSWPART